MTNAIKEQIDRAIAQIELTPALVERLARVHAMALQHRAARLKAQHTFRMTFRFEVR